MFDADNNQTGYHYDDKKRLTGIQKSDSIERFFWDDQSRLQSKTVEDFNWKVHLRQSYTYDSSGNVIEETLCGDLSGSGQLESYTLYRTYEKDDPFYLKRSETDGLGKITYYTYKPGTNLLETESIYTGDTLLYRTSYQYDDCAICIKKTVEAPSYTRITTTVPKKSFPCFGLPETVEENTLDGHGNALLLSKVMYTYHPSGKIENEVHFDATGTHCYTLYNTYDSKDRLISSTDALGHETTYQYDNQNNLILQKSPLQQITWKYDLENRPLSENTSGLEKQFTYDKLGRVIRSTDPSGHTTHYTYDPLGRVIRTQHPDGGIEHKQYDILGNIIQETDPNGHTTQKRYNIRNQITYILYPDGTEETFKYDLKGNLVRHTKNACQTDYTYDLLDVRHEVAQILVVAKQQPQILLCDSTGRCV